jgi:glucose uptake protein
MILPQNGAATLLILLLALLCLGSWANAFKLGGKRRYELFYFDWMVGSFVTVVILALTVGSLGYDGFSFRDDLMITARRAWLYAFLAGVIFNLGNMLLIAAVSVAGMAVAFPMAAGVSMLVSAVVAFVVNHAPPATFLMMGCALLLGAVAAAALAHRGLLMLRHEDVARAGRAKSTRRPSAAKAIILAATGGLLLGLFFPLADRARAGEIGLGPYSFGFLFVFGSAASALFFNLFLMNLPVEGEPIEIPAYFREPAFAHLLGLAGGAVWCIGMVAAFISEAAALPPAAQPNPAATYGLTQGGAFLAALWGIFAWKELDDADGRVKLLAGLMLLFLAGGIGVFAVAPLFGAW